MYTAETTDIRSQYPARDFKKTEIRDDRSNLCKKLNRKNGVKNEIESLKSKLMFPQFKLSSKFEGYMYIKILSNSDLSYMLDEYYTDKYSARENKQIRQFIAELALETITEEFRVAYGIKVEELKCLSSLVRKIENVRSIWPEYIQQAVYYAAKNYLLGDNNPESYYRLRREELDLWSKQNQGNYFIQKIAKLITQDVNAVLLILANIVSRNPSPYNQYFDEVDGNYSSANLWGEGAVFPHYIGQLKLRPQFQNHILFENALQHGQKRSYEEFERGNYDPDDEEMFVPQSMSQDYLPQVEAVTSEQNTVAVPSEFEEVPDCLTKLHELYDQIKNKGRFSNWYGDEDLAKNPNIKAERRVLYYLFNSQVFELGMEPIFSTDEALVLSPNFEATKEMKTNSNGPGTDAMKINDYGKLTIGRFTADYFRKFGLQLKLCEDETFNFCKLGSSGRKSMVFEFKEREITLVEYFSKISTASKDGNATTTVSIGDLPPVSSLLDLENPPTSLPATPSPVERQQIFKRLRTSTPNNQPSLNVSKSFESLKPCLPEHSKLAGSAPDTAQEPCEPHKPKETALEQRENSNMQKMNGLDPGKDSQSTKESHQVCDEGPEVQIGIQQELYIPSNDSQNVPDKSKDVLNASEEQMKSQQASDGQIEEPETVSIEPINIPLAPKITTHDSNGYSQSTSGRSQCPKKPGQGPTAQAPTATTRPPKPTSHGPRTANQPRKTVQPRRRTNQLKAASKPSKKPSVASILGIGKSKRSQSTAPKNQVKDSQKPVLASGVRNGASKEPKGVPEDPKDPKNRRQGPQKTSQESNQTPEENENEQPELISNPDNPGDPSDCNASGILKEAMEPFNSNPTTQTP